MSDSIPIEHRNVTFRLLPGSRENARRLAMIAGACRFVWNEMLDQQEQIHIIAGMCAARTPDVLHPCQGVLEPQSRSLTASITFFLAPAACRPVRHRILEIRKTTSDNGAVIGVDMNAGQVTSSDGVRAPDTRRREAASGNRELAAVEPRRSGIDDGETHDPVLPPGSATRPRGLSLFRRVIPVNLARNAVSWTPGPAARKRSSNAWPVAMPTMRT